MEGSKGFSEVWTEAHRQRSEYFWSIISRLMTTSRRPAPQPEQAHDYQPVYGTLVKTH